MFGFKLIFFFSFLLYMIEQSSAVLPGYSVTIVEKCLTDLAIHIPAFSELSTLLVPFLTNLLNNLNNLTNIVQNLTPALLPYFGCSLPLLISALSDLFSILILYVGTAVSLLSSGLLMGPGVFALVATVLNAALELLESVADPKELLVEVSGLIENVVESLTF